MKKLIFTILGCLLAVVTHAQGFSVKVSFADGSEQSFDLTDAVTISLGDGSMSISSPEAEASYAIEDVACFRYVDHSGIKDVAVGSGITLGPDFLQINKDGFDCADVYSLDGRLVTTILVGDDGVVDLSMLKGVYILRVGEDSFKIRVKR